MKKRAYYFVVMMFAGGCLNPPEYPVEPEIRFLSISRTTISQLDTVRVEFEFTDGDGDIGKEKPDSVDCNLCHFDSCYRTDWNLYLTDLRLGCIERYMIPYIPPKGSSDAISGKINIVINGICCLYPDSSGCVPNVNYPLDTVIYTLQMKDRAGHLSNKIELPPIVIQCN
ncbi:MAG TPA: hypothetical protein VNJ07_02110 [Chitinophagales bacterium]|nr:hypothetical protein [Chitinophagales bacterium]